MNSLALLICCFAAALAAPQVPHSHVLPGAGSSAYTLTNRPQGFSIETGAAAVRAQPVQPAFYGQQHVASQAASASAAAAAQFAAQQQAAYQTAARKVVVAQPAPIHYTPVQYPAQFTAQNQATHYAADQAAAYAAKHAAVHKAVAVHSAPIIPAQQYASAAAPAYRSANIVPSANIVRQQQDISDDGSAFTYGFESDNGIAVQSQGNLKVLGPEAAGHSVTGSYSYVGDDGQTYTVNYVADETGFHASGAHIPQMSEEIARSVEWNLAHPEEWTQQ